MAEQPPRHYVLEVPGLPLAANARRRSAWPALYRDGKTFKEATALLARSVHQGPPLVRACVLATRVRPRGKALDPDNCTASLKAVLDGLVAGGLVVDDDEEHLELVVAQEQGGRASVRLEITELLED